jgi:hypothetical protein
MSMLVPDFAAVRWFFNYRFPCVEERAFEKQIINDRRTRKKLPYCIGLWAFIRSSVNTFCGRFTPIRAIPAAQQKKRPGLRINPHRWVWLDM